MCKHVVHIVPNLGRSTMARDSPSTKSRFERTEPIKVARATVVRPRTSAIILSINSGALPKEALIKPPATGPQRSARSSVMHPRSHAKGTSPTTFCTGHVMLLQYLAFCMSMHGANR